MLPKIGTEQWDAEVEAFTKSTPEWRRNRAKELGYANANSYATKMNHYGVHLSKSQITPPITSDYKLPPDSSWEEHIRIIRDMEKLVDYHRKVPNEVTIKIDTDLPIALTEVADIHIGQPGVDYDSFEYDMNVIESEPGLYVNLGGDIHHNIIQASKIGSSHDQTPIPVQCGLTVLTVKKLIHKINTMRTGNHNAWTATLTGEDWTESLQSDTI